VIESFGVRHEVVSPEMCLDLDSLADDQPAAESTTSALPPGFEEHIGPTRTMEIAVNRT
jgi:hypothetical protein